MKLFAVYTEEHGVLKDEWFVKTLRDPFDLRLKNIGSSGQHRPEFRSAPWLKALRARHEYCREAIAQNQGETIVLSDLDVQFFGRCLPRIKKAMEGRDIVFQSEHWPFRGVVNAGFVSVRCNPRTLALYETVSSIEFEKLEIADQTALNNLLAADSSRVRWDVFGNEIWARSHGKRPPHSILLHHANCTRNVEEKIEQLTWVRDIVRARRRNPIRFAASYLQQRRRKAREGRKPET